MAITVRKDKHGNPRAFQATVRIRGERSASRTFDSYEAAREFETKTMSAIKGAKGLEAKRQSVGAVASPVKLASFVSESVAEIVDLYMAAHPDDKRVRPYREALKRRVGAVRVCELSKKWTRGFVERMSKEPAGARGGTIKDSTINFYLRLIGRVCKWRAEELEVTCPPLGLTKQFFAPDWNDGRSRRLRAGEEERIREALGRIGAKPYWANAPELYGRAYPCARHYQLAFDFALETCAREAEIVDLPWREIDLECREWQLPGWRTKTGRSRTIYLSLKAVDILVELEKCRLPDSDRVFHLLPKPACFSSTFGVALKKAGIKGFVFHDTRHEAISRLLTSGAMLPGAVLKMAGHSSLKMTMRYFNPQRDEVIGRMDTVHARDAAWEAKTLEQHVVATFDENPPPKAAQRL